MTIWDWIRGFEADAQARGDRERLRMAQIHNEAYAHRQSDPDRMLEILEEGRRLALRLEEPWWVLFFEQWKLETLIYYKDDYRKVIDHAVRLTLELRKPGFENYPLRFGIWCNLVAAHLCVDPRGYADAIREALAYLQSCVPEEGGDRYLLQARRHWCAYELGDLEEAQRLALQELAMADSDSELHTAHHHEVDTYKALCWIAFKRQDWPGLLNFATTGEERARAIRYHYELALFQLWRGVCARRDGQEDSARRLIRQGTKRMGRLRQPPGESYYDALAYFHELGGEYQTAWQVRQRELETTLDKGQLAYECQVRLKRVRLLRKMDQPFEEETALAREAAQKLRAPAWYLRELQRILEE
jgi:hypothetical protein